MNCKMQNPLLVYPPGPGFWASVQNWGANSYSNILKGMNVWMTKIHDSKVGVVAFNKISGFLLCTFFGFFENLSLDGVFYNCRYFFAKYV